MSRYFSLGVAILAAFASTNLRRRAHDRSIVGHHRHADRSFGRPGNGHAGNVVLHARTSPLRRSAQRHPRASRHENRATQRTLGCHAMVRPLQQPPDDRRRLLARRLRAALGLQWLQSGRMGRRRRRNDDLLRRLDPATKCRTAEIASTPGTIDGVAYTIPFRTAHTAACVRSVTPIFRRMCCTCSFTVS